MKNKLFALGCAAICGFSLSSCVVDPYGYPMTGGNYRSGYSNGYSNSRNYGNGYASTGYYGSGYNSGYAAPCNTPTFTSLSFFGGSGWGNGYSNSGYGYGGSGYAGSQYRGGYNTCQPPASFGSHHGSHVTRPSMFQGGGIMSSPPATRTFQSPSFQHSSPGHSFGSPSGSMPGGHSNHGGRPIIQASNPMPAHSSSGGFAGVASGHHHRGH